MLPRQQSWLQSLSALNQILLFVTKRGKEGHIQNTHNAHIVLVFSFAIKEGTMFVKPKLKKRRSVILAKKNT